MASWRVFAALVLLGTVCAGIVDSHCDLPGATSSKAATVTEASPQSSPDDACGSVCVPDCYSCSRSDDPGVAHLAFDSQAVAVAFVLSDPRPSDGVSSLPYHPPLRLL
jgi:hypothetical protein